MVAVSQEETHDSKSDLPLVCTKKKDQSMFDFIFLKVALFLHTRGKSLLESWLTTFLSD